MSLFRSGQLILASSIYKTKFLLPITAIEMDCIVCDFSQSNALASPFQIPIAHFDQNRTIKYQLSLTLVFIITEKRGKPISLTGENFKC